MPFRQSLLLFFTGAAIGLAEQLFGDSQIHRGRVWINVAEEGGEVHQPAVGVDAFAIPAE
jgi:hypothetical protein